MSADVFNKNALLEAKKKKDPLVSRLKLISKALAERDQNQPTKPLDGIAQVLIQPDLLKHKDVEVRLLVGCCLADLMRLYAPESPYTDAEIKSLFALVIELLQGLERPDRDSFVRVYHILEQLSIVQSFVLLADYVEDGLMERLFTVLLHSVLPTHSHKLKEHVLNVLVLCLNALTFVPRGVMEALLMPLLEPMKTERPAAYALVQQTLARANDSAQTAVTQYIVELLTKPDEESNLSSSAVYDLIYEIHLSNPALLMGVIPALADELKMDDLEKRSAAVKLLGRMFASPLPSSLHTAYPALWTEFTGRFVDKEADVRLLMARFARDMLLNHRDTAPTLTVLLEGRALDPEDKVRKEVVSTVCAVAATQPGAIPVQLLRSCADRMRDKKAGVRREAIKAFAGLYAAVKGTRASWTADEHDRFAWIPAAIVGCYGSLPAEDVAMRFYVERQLDEALLPSAEGAGAAEARGFALAQMYVDLPAAGREALSRLLREKHRAQAELVKYAEAKRSKGAEATAAAAAALTELTKLPDPTEKRAADLLAALDGVRNMAVFKGIVAACDPTATLAAILAAKEAVRSGLKAADAARCLDYVEPMLMRAANTLLPKDAVPGVFAYCRKADSPDDTVAALHLLQVCANEFPLTMTEAGPPLLALLDEEEEPALVEAALRVLLPAIPSLSAAIVKSLKDKLVGLCESGGAKAAKLAMRVLSRLPGTDTHVAQLLDDLVARLGPNATPEALDSALGALGQAAQNPATAKLFGQHYVPVTKFIVSDMLGFPKKGKSTRVYGVETKMRGLKVLALSLVGQTDTPKERVLPVLKLLVHIMNAQGVLHPDEPTRASEAERLWGAAAAVMLRLMRVSHVRTLTTAADYHALAYTALSRSEAVRDLLLRKLSVGLLRHHLVPAYAAILGLYATAGAEAQEHARTLLRQFVASRRALLHRLDIPIGSVAASNVLPEYTLPAFVHLLAHHPQFEADRLDKYSLTRKYLSFFLEPLMHDSDTYALMMIILHTISLAGDIMNPQSTAIYEVVELASMELRRRSMGHKVELQAITQQVFLPVNLFTRRQIKPQPSYLVDGGALMATPKKATPTKRAARSEADDAGSGSDGRASDSEPEVLPKTGGRAARAAKRLAESDDSDGSAVEPAAPAPTPRKARSAQPSSAAAAAAGSARKRAAATPATELRLDASDSDGSEVGAASDDGAGVGGPRVTAKQPPPPPQPAKRTKATTAAAPASASSAAVGAGADTPRRSKRTAEAAASAPAKVQKSADSDLELNEDFKDLKQTHLSLRRRR